MDDVVILYAILVKDLKIDIIVNSKKYKIMNKVCNLFKIIFIHICISVLTTINQLM